MDPPNQVSFSYQGQNTSSLFNFRINATKLESIKVDIHPMVAMDEKIYNFYEILFFYAIELIFAFKKIMSIIFIILVENFNIFFDIFTIFLFIFLN